MRADTIAQTRPTTSTPDMASSFSRGDPAGEIEREIRDLRSRGCKARSLARDDAAKKDGREWQIGQTQERLGKALARRNFVR